MIRKLLGLLSLAWLGGCAVVIAPDGGPKDSSAVAVVRSLPVSGAINVPRNQVVELQWNKWVQAASLGKSMTISPAAPGRTKIDLNGDVVRLTFAEPLDSPATYSIRFAPGIKDWRDGQSRQEIELAFATGARMDSGLVEVRAVVNGTPAMLAPLGTRVGLYPLDSLRRAGLKRLLRSRDSVQWLGSAPVPLREKPLYSATVDSLGIAHVRHVPPGRYLVVASTDRGGDGFCRLASDSAGLVGIAELASSNAVWRASTLLGRLDTVPMRKDSVDTTKWAKAQHDSVSRFDSLARLDSLRLDSLTALDTVRPADSMAVITLADTLLRDSLHEFKVSENVLLWAQAWPQGLRTRPVLRPFVQGRARLPLKPGRWRLEVWLDRDGDKRPTPSSLLKERLSEPYWLWKDRDFPAGFVGSP